MHISHCTLTAYALYALDLQVSFVSFLLSVFYNVDARKHDWFIMIPLFILSCVTFLSPFCYAW